MDKKWPCPRCGKVLVTHPRRYCPACKEASEKEYWQTYRRKKRSTDLDWIRKTAKINAAARKAGMTYGQYVAAMGRALRP